MRVTPTRDAKPRLERKAILTVVSPEMSSGAACQIWSTPSSGAWFSANDPIAIPFRISQVATVTQLGWMNGSSAGGNVDIGIYDSAWKRLTSSGSTVGSGNTNWQFVDVADVTLYPGRVYYVVMSRDNVTANRQRFLSMGVASNVPLALHGIQDSATDAFPLPDPLTNMAAAATATLVPVVAVAFKEPFA